MPSPAQDNDPQPPALPCRRVLILGLGLLGGSFGLALQQAEPTATLWGRDSNPDHEAAALAQGLVHQAWVSTAPPEPFDLVFLAVPTGRIGAALEGLGPWLRPGTLIVDACSVKVPVLAAVRKALGGHPGFVPSHPIAGSHRSGPGAAEAGLFQGATVVLTPPPEADPAAVRRARALWQGLGARIQVLEPQVHDQVLGLLSHLPQLLSFAYVDQVAEAGVDLGLAGPGFRDFTRLAQSSPELWADLALANRGELLPLLQAAREHLAALELRLAGGDRAALTAGFRRASELRTAWAASRSGA
jgi:prephenate dehydrogenase